MYNYYNSYSQCIQPLQLYITVLLCCGALLWQLCCGSSAVAARQLFYGSSAMVAMLWQLCIGNIIVIAATLGCYGSYVLAVS